MPIDKRSARSAGQRRAARDDDAVTRIRGRLLDLSYELAVADEPGDMRIWHRTPGGWAPIWEMGASSDAMALLELGGWPAVITPHRIYVATGELWTQELGLSPELPSSRMTQPERRSSATSTSPMTTLMALSS